MEEVKDAYSLPLLLKVLFLVMGNIKIARRNINNLRYANDTTLLAEREEELKSLLMNVKEESEKVGLKLNIITLYAEQKKKKKKKTQIYRTVF